MNQYCTEQVDVLEVGSRNTIRKRAGHVTLHHLKLYRLYGRHTSVQWTITVSSIPIGYFIDSVGIHVITIILIRQSRLRHKIWHIHDSLIGNRHNEGLFSQCQKWFDKRHLVSQGQNEANTPEIHSSTPHPNELRPRLRTVHWVVIQQSGSPIARKPNC